jgi:hypothetical protein
VGAVFLSEGIQKFLFPAFRRVGQIGQYCLAVFFFHSKAVGIGH